MRDVVKCLLFVFMLIFSGVVLALDLESYGPCKDYLDYASAGNQADIKKIEEAAVRSGTLLRKMELLEEQQQYQAMKCELVKVHTYTKIDRLKAEFAKTNFERAKASGKACMSFIRLSYSNPDNDAKTISETETALKNLEKIDDGIDDLLNSSLRALNKNLKLRKGYIQSKAKQYNVNLNNTSLCKQLNTKGSVSTKKTIVTPKLTAHESKIYHYCENFKASGNPDAAKIKSCGCLAKYGVQSAYNTSDEYFHMYQKLPKKPSIYTFYTLAAYSYHFPKAVGCFVGGGSYAKQRVKSYPADYQESTYYRDYYGVYLDQAEKMGFKKNQNPECRRSWLGLADQVAKYDACELFEEFKVYKNNAAKIGKEVYRLSHNVCSHRADANTQEMLGAKCTLQRYGDATGVEKILSMHLRQDLTKLKDGQCPQYSANDYDDHNQSYMLLNDGRKLPHRTVYGMTPSTPLSLSVPSDVSQLTDKKRIAETKKWDKNRALFMQCVVNHFERSFLN